MSLAYFTITPEPVFFPKAYLVRVFKESHSGEARCIETVSFPVCNFDFPLRTYKQAREYGEKSVSVIIDKCLACEGE